MRLPLPLTLGAALLALAPLAAAQNAIGVSPSWTRLAAGTPGGELASSTNGALRATVRLGAGDVGQEAASPSFRLRVNTLGPASFAAVGPPLVAHVAGDAGPAAGGTHFEVLGRRLVGGVGSAQVDVGGASANVLAATPDTLRVVTGPGANPHGNPLGPSDVTVTHALGAGARDDAFAYLPAVRNASSASLGSTLHLEVATLQPGGYVQVWAGSTVPGVAVPIAPFAGALEAWGGAVALSGLVPAPAATRAFDVPVPADASFLGLTVAVQAISVEQLAPALLGSFTNALPVTIGP